MKKIEVQGSLTLEHKGNLYTVNSDVYYWDPYDVYPRGTYVLFKDTLYKAKCKTAGSVITNFELVPPTDRVTVTATNDDLVPLYTDIEKLKAKLGIEDPVDPGFTAPGTGEPEPEAPKPETPEDVDPDMAVVPGMLELQGRVNLIEQTYVRTINNTQATNGNINIDFDGSAMPPESTIVRFTDGNIHLPEQASIQYIVQDVPMDVVQYNSSLILGSDLTHLELKSVDTVTVNGNTVVTTEDVVTLLDDQNIQGRKHFEALFTTEAPQEDQQVPNSKWVRRHVAKKIQEAVKPRLNQEQVFYISALNLSDVEDGTEEHPFKTLKNAVSFIKKIDLNFNDISLEFKDRYEDNSEMLELPELGATVTIRSRTGLDTVLPPLYVTGHWRLEGVTLSDNRLAQTPLEVDKGYCVLGTVAIKLASPAPGTDGVFVHNNGTVQLASKGSLTITNESSTPVLRAVHLKAGTLICNEDVHANVGEVNTITVEPDNGGFGVGLFLDNVSRCIYMENTEYTCGASLPYVAKNVSIIQGIKQLGLGEQDASSVVTS